MRLIGTYFNILMLVLCLGACSPIIRLLNSSQPDTNQMPIASRVVNASNALNRPLGANFRRLTTVANPCGTFGGAMVFGVNSDLLNVSCTPDNRTAVSNGNNGLFGLISAPTGAPWRVALNIANGRELERLFSFTPCSAKLDAFELALGNGEAFFQCTPDLSSLEFSWRLITKGQHQEPIKLIIPATYKYRYFWVDKRLIRQATTSLPPGPMLFSEVAVAARKLDWRTWRFDPDPKACGTAIQETPDKARLIAFVGKIVMEEPSGGVTYARCHDEKLTFVSPEQSAAQPRFALWAPGMVSHTLYNQRLLVVNRMSSSWNTKYPVANVVSETGPELSIITGEGIAPWRYSGVSVIEGHGLIVLEVAPRVRLGGRPFMYVVFNWDGAPLARFYATRVALAPDRPRIVATFGKTIETWDLK